MLFDPRSWLMAVALAALSCGGGQEQPASAADEEGPTERAGKKLDETAHDIHEKGDEVGQDVKETFDEAGKDVNEKLGNDPKAPPPEK